MNHKKLGQSRVFKGNSMTDNKNVKVDSSPSDWGMFAKHPEKKRLAYFVAPSTSDKKVINTVKLEANVVACWKVEDICFDFDEAFVKKETSNEFEKLRDLYNKLVNLFEQHPKFKEHPRPPISIFGHADPVGKDPYNKTLSERRAKAIYGVLLKDPGIWKDVFKGKDGLKYLQGKLKDAGHHPGPATGAMNSETEKAIKSYMKELFPDFKLEQADFLGNSSGECAFQGCSEFNPVLMFSKKEWEDFKKPENKKRRDEENQPNRRVVAYLFEPGTKVDPKLWPCPKAPEIQGCIDRFWLDKDVRRSFKDIRRTKDTYACRFYERIARLSPCESVKIIKPIIRLRFEETTRKFLTRLQYVNREVEGEIRTFMEWTDTSGHVHTASDGFFSTFAKDLEFLEYKKQGRLVAKDETHLVKTHFTETRKAGVSWYVLQAVVVDPKEPNKELFRGEVEAGQLFDKGGTWVRTGGGGGKEVWRLEKDIKDGAGVYDLRQRKVVSYKTLERKEIKSEPGLHEKMKDLYEQLSGGPDSSITKRIEDMVTKAWKKAMESTLEAE